MWLLLGVHNLALLFLMVFGFYTLMQEPYCVREFFFFFFQVTDVNVSHTILPSFLPLLLANLSSHARM